MDLSNELIGRRNFLARVGILGAVAATGAIVPGTASAAPPALRPVLAALSKDTFNGLVVLTCPGRDAYSLAQGTPRAEPGGLDARGAEFAIDVLDRYLPVPDLAIPLTRAMANGLAEAPVSLPSMPLEQVRTLDQALRVVLASDQTIPISWLVALLLNLLATQADPLAVNGPFLSPFARLSYPKKCEAFRLLEGPDAKLVSLVDSQLPEPLKDSASGLLRYLAGAVLEITTFGSYNEWGVYDPAARTLRARPVGWRLSGYQPNGVVDGWHEFLGYYQGRTEVHD